MVDTDKLGIPRSSNMKIYLSTCQVPTGETSSKKAQHWCKVRGEKHNSNNLLLSCESEKCHTKKAWEKMLYIFLIGKFIVLIGTWMNLEPPTIRSGFLRYNIMQKARTCSYEIIGGIKSNLDPYGDPPNPKCVCADLPWESKWCISHQVGDFNSYRSENCSVIVTPVATGNSSQLPSVHSLKRTFNSPPGSPYW